jgi:hypothetical protein
MNERWNEHELHRVHEAARNRARRLRAEAIADFWHSLYAALDAASDTAGRAARRLAHRIRHHRAVRQAISES